MCLYIFKQLNWLANIFVYIVSFFSKINKLLLPLYILLIYNVIGSFQCFIHQQQVKFCYFAPFSKSLMISFLAIDVCLSF